MPRDDKHGDRGYGEEGRTREEQDRAAEGGGDSHRRDSEEPGVPSKTEDQTMPETDEIEA